jgi:hypothetical protein
MIIILSLMLYIHKNLNEVCKSVINEYQESYDQLITKYEAKMYILSIPADLLYEERR